MQPYQNRNFNLLKGFIPLPSTLKSVLPESERKKSKYILQFFGPELIIFLLIFVDHHISKFLFKDSVYEKMQTQIDEQIKGGRRQSILRRDSGSQTSNIKFYEYVLQQIEPQLLG